MEARFLGCAMATYWLPHTLVQITFHLVLVHKKVWCSLSSLSIQIGVLAVTFRITLMSFISNQDNLCSEILRKRPKKFQLKKRSEIIFFLVA